MKMLCLCLLCVYILFLNFFQARKIKNNTCALQEILNVIYSMKGELSFRQSDCQTLCTNAVGEQSRFVYLSENTMKIKGDACRCAQDDFAAFASKIGTTDKEGQIALCDEYIARFEGLLGEVKAKEKSKIQVNTALGLLGAVTLIVFFM